MNSWIGDKICLKLIEVHIQCPIKSQRGSDGGDDLGNQAVEIGVGRSGNRLTLHSARKKTGNLVQYL